MSKINLTDLGSIQQNPTSAATVINNNFSTIEDAFENTLSRDGTSPNKMAASLDMDSNRILNLPQPATNSEPLRLQDLSDFTGGGTVTNIPAGGTTGQVLAKTTNADYAVGWVSESSELTAGTNIAITGTSPATISTVASPTFTHVTAEGVTSTGATGTGSLVFATSPTLSSPTFTTPALGTPASGTLTNCTLPTTAITGLGTGVGTALTAAVTGSGGISLTTSPSFTTPLLGTPTSGTLTNCTGLPISTGVSGLGSGVATFLGTASSANLATAMTTKTGTAGNLVFSNTPTLVTPVLGAATATSINGSTVSPGHYSGEPSNGGAVAGEIGEFVSSNILSGSAVSLTTGTPTNITSISLTAGDWDVWAVPCFTGGATTTLVAYRSSISTTSATENTASPNYTAVYFNGAAPFGTFDLSTSIAPIRASISSTTTYFLVTRVNFGVSTCSGYGGIFARRAR